MWCKLSGGYSESRVYKDIALALIFTYGIYLIAHKDALRGHFGFVSLVIASTLLLLTKQLGMAFILVIWIYYYTIRFHLCWKESQISRLREIIVL